MRNIDVIPNYYSYSLKVNGRDLTIPQKELFFNCINKIHRENHKVIYRGDKKNRIQHLFGVNNGQFDDEFHQYLFLMGIKGQIFSKSELPGINEIDIAKAGENEFNLIFRMLGNLLKKEFPFGAIRMAVKSFNSSEEEVKNFFCNQENEQHFIDRTNMITPEKRIVVRDYYLALLHHINKSEYYPSSFLLSVTTSYQQAHKFAIKEQNTNDNIPIILFGWIPKNYEGILRAPDSRFLNQQVNMNILQLPVYKQSFFPMQREITLKGGILPHYLLGYLYTHHNHEVFEINPALLEIDDSWDGVELPIDQSTFHQRMQKTLFGQYFSVETENGQYNQHRKL